jgi:hypothetical protein
MGYAPITIFYSGITMHPLLHRLAPATREILGLLRKHPNNTPTFVLSLYGDTNSSIRAVGPFGKKTERVILKHGFDSGYFFALAFYTILDNLAAQGPTLTLSWKDRFGKVRKAPYSRQQISALSLSPKPVRKVRIRITSADANNHTPV